MNAANFRKGKKANPPCLEYDKRAIAYAEKYHFPMTAGSDQHSTSMLYGGMVFARKLKDIHDFTRAVMSGEAVQLLDGSTRVTEE